MAVLYSKTFNKGRDDGGEAFCFSFVVSLSIKDILWVAWQVPVLQKIAQKKEFKVIDFLGAYYFMILQMQHSVKGRIIELDIQWFASLFLPYELWDFKQVT